MPANLTAYQLRSLVLDYLCHSCYTNTARAFNRDSTVRHLDADGDEIVESLNPDGSGFSATVGGRRSAERFEQHLREVELRQEIRTQILSGRVEEAIALLNKHFPSVLSETAASTMVENLGSDSLSSTNDVEYISSTSTEPAHLLLNLHILAFCEACRTVPLEYPTKQGSMEAYSYLTESETSLEPAVNQESLEKLLARAQKLYVRMTMLPNPADHATYLKELERVGGLLAYKVPEKSSISKYYLSLERREAVANQINRAILKRTGKPLISTIELITRHTHVLWQNAHRLGVKPRPGTALPPRNTKTTSLSGADSEFVPTFDLHQFLESKP
ncbi:CTLH/CRA C-terminal to lish motif domain-containing protein [Gymnopilus junonius]|uniref:CTLH/CRA C-terminal to lish motif domain-containing protein n=1 Tax=Gymnopilus junonius TaxID=109634 RepID=A0A9P5P1F7_GYMJU|nr:CTLH/CRA C-terminal to lish motif domain-containing protein [Gymnopilus junonius]